MLLSRRVQLRVRRYADTFVNAVKRYTVLPLKQAVMSASALSLMYPVDDCGFFPFCDDKSTRRETAFAKITARVHGTRLASEALGIK